MEAKGDDMDKLRSLPPAFVCGLVPSTAPTPALEPGPPWQSSR